MLILILIDVQYSQKAVFSFEKGSNGQNYLLFFKFQPPSKKIPQQNVWFLPTLNAIWKSLGLIVSKSGFTCSGLRLFPGRGEYEFAFEFVNLLLKIKGKKRPNFVIFVVRNAFFIGIHSIQGWTATKRHGVTRKTSTKRSTNTGNLFRKNLQLIDLC